MPFWPLQSICCKSEAVLSKNFRHGHPGGSVNVFGKIFVSVTEVSLDEHIEIFKRERVTRRDLGNRATPVDRAHIKRPSSKQIYWGQISVFIVFQTFIREFLVVEMSTSRFDIKRGNLKRDKLCELL